MGAIYRVSQCCCGCSLRTGTLIILWMDMILFALFLISALSGTSNQNIPTNKSDHTTTTSHLRTTRNTEHNTSEESSTGGTSSSVILLGLLILGLLVIILVIKIYGLIGAINRRPKYMLPQVILYVVSVILLAVFIVLTLIALVFIEEFVNMRYGDKIKALGPFGPIAMQMLCQEYQSMFIKRAVGGAVCCGLNYYFLCVIYSYYKQLQEEANGTSNPGTRVGYSAPQGQPLLLTHEPQPAAANYPKIQVAYPPQYAP